MGEDLFRAIRGGGGSFGVILAYRIKLVRVPATVTVFKLQRFFGDNATEPVHKFQRTVPQIDDNLFIRILLQPVVTVNKNRVLRATFTGQFLGNSDQLLHITSSQFPKLGRGGVGLMDRIPESETPFPHRKGILYKGFRIWASEAPTAARDWLKYFKNNFYRLVQIKTQVDPDNVFRNEQSIPTFPNRLLVNSG
ncbi:hypothetical protein M569_12389 [Genlisea aurea]|uniref:Berberine/berberine-like domain-containing protein n=1 Tax=Genlisea aurea TaxID=192259 RepID=S8C6K0_9LAMI|nr:hypothetical protein M569_12389 [Genlisea aurea]